MKKIILAATVAFATGLSPSCTQESSTSGHEEVPAPSSSNYELWAEQVESTTDVVKPDGWSEQDWNSVTKNIDREKIFISITQAALSGKQQAYNYITDSALTVEQVKSSLVLSETSNVGAKDISHIRVKEKLYFDAENFKLLKQPTALSLFVNSYAEDGSIRGYKPLFYVKLKN